MRRNTLFGILLATGLLTSHVAEATSYAGYVRNWWVNENGDITFYFLDSANNTWITGLCGWGNYNLKAGNANFDEVYSSLIKAAEKSYKVLMEVTECDVSTNIIKAVKVCTWTGDC
jgi:hypothetical protein